MKNRRGVIVVGGGAVRRVHPALARVRRRQGRWRRPRGHSFRLRPETRHEERATPQGSGAARRKVWKLSLYATGPLFPYGHRHSDGRTLRGALLRLIEQRLGWDAMVRISNHGTTRKSPWAVSVSRNNSRRAFVTLLSADDGVALDLLRKLQRLVEGCTLTLGDGGPGTHDVRILDAKLTLWSVRGTYLDVAATDAREAALIVPGAGAAQVREGRAGKRAEAKPWRVNTVRAVRCPVQVGPMASYGCGVIA